MSDYYRHWSRRLIYTLGVKCMAEDHGAYWLIDAVASYATYPEVAREPFALWTLTVNPDKSAVLEMRSDSGRPAIIRQEIEYTDFPESIDLYVCHSEELPVLMTCEEY